MEKKAFKIFCIIGRVLVILSIAVLVVTAIIFSVEEYKARRGNPYPKEGVWYCEELQMQISFDDSELSYYIENGKKIRCGWHCKPYEYGIMYIYPKEDGANSFQFQRSTSDYFVVKDLDTGIKYKFVRQ